MYKKIRTVRYTVQLILRMLINICNRFLILIKIFFWKKIFLIAEICIFVFSKFNLNWMNNSREKKNRTARYTAQSILRNTLFIIHPKCCQISDGSWSFNWWINEWTNGWLTISYIMQYGHTKSGLTMSRRRHDPLTMTFSRKRSPFGNDRSSFPSCWWFFLLLRFCQFGFLCWDVFSGDRCRFVIGFWIVWWWGFFRIWKCLKI